MSEAKLDITGSVAEIQKKIDSLTKTVAGLREENRKLNKESKDGYKGSADAVNDFATRMTKAQVSVDAWRTKTAASAKGSDAWANAVGEMSSKMIASHYSMEIGFQKMRESGKLTRMAAAGVDGLSSTLGRFGGPAAIAAAGVAVITRELMKFNEQQAGAVQHHREWQDELAKTIAGGKNATNGGKLEEFTKSVPGATKADALAAFQGVESEMQSSSFEKKAGVAKAVARLGITGADISKGGAGGMAGFLAQDVLPKYKSEDAADVAAMLQQEAGGDFEKIGGEAAKRAMQQLISSGAMTPEESIGTVLAAARGDMSAKTLTQLAKTASDSKEQIGGIGESGKVAAAKRRLGKMGPRERIAAMLSDKTMAEAGLGENAIELEKSRLSMEEISANAELVSGVQSRDVIGERRQGMATSAAGRARATRYQNIATKEQNESALTRRNELLTTLDEQVRTRSAGNGFAGFIGSEITNATRQSATLSGYGPDASPGSIKALEMMVELNRRQLQLMEEEGKKRPVVNDGKERP